MFVRFSLVRDLKIHDFNTVVSEWQKNEKMHKDTFKEWNKMQQQIKL